jgi:hypothetical protein
MPPSRRTRTTCPPSRAQSTDNVSDGGRAALGSLGRVPTGTNDDGDAKNVLESYSTLTDCDMSVTTGINSLL